MNHMGYFERAAMTALTLLFCFTCGCTTTVSGPEDGDEDVTLAQDTQADTGSAGDAGVDTQTGTDVAPDVRDDAPSDTDTGADVPGDPDVAGDVADDEDVVGDMPMDAEADLDVDDDADLAGDTAGGDTALDPDADAAIGSDTNVASDADAVDVSPFVECVTSGTIVCMGLNPDWPGGTTMDPSAWDGNFVIPPGYTHVWEFHYLGGHQTGVGTIGTINGPSKRQSITQTPGFFSDTDNECSNMQGSGEGAVAFEPAPGTISWRCDLTDGERYYYNLRNESATDSAYRVVIF